jgi:hypothetical protein
MRIASIFSGGNDGPPPTDAECAEIAVGVTAKAACKWLQDPTHWYSGDDIADQDLPR